MYYSEINYNDALREMIIYAYENSLFYKWFYTLHNVDVFKIRGFQDYVRLPILRKEDILNFMGTQNVHDIHNICCMSNKIFNFSTTGTTTKHLLVPYTREELELCAQCIITSLNWWGYKIENPLNSLIFGHPQDIGTAILSNVSKITRGESYQYAKIKGQVDSISVKNGESLTFINSLSTLNNMLNLPSYMTLFKKINLKYILTLVTPPEFRSKFHIEISQKLGDIDLIPIYGSIEMGIVGCSCPYIFPSSYVHIVQNGIFHVTEDENYLKNSGKGKLIYTSLDKKSFPFIKYYVGDNVSLKQTDKFCKCGFPNNIVRFESRESLDIKIPDAAGYFINIFRVDEIIKQILPGSQMICVYGEHKSDYYLFLSIFIYIGKKTIDSCEQKNIKNKIIRKIIQNHLPRGKIKEKGISNLISQFSKNFPIFFVNATEIPKEPGATKPKILLNLMENGDLIKTVVYHDLFSKLDNYLLL